MAKGDLPEKAAGGSEMEEAQRAMAQLERTISEMKRSSSGVKVREDKSTKGGGTPCMFCQV